MVIAVIIPLFNILAVFALEYFRGGRFRSARQLRGIVTNPLIIASLLGVLMLASGWKLPCRDGKDGGGYSRGRYAARVGGAGRFV